MRASVGGGDAFGTMVTGLLLVMVTVFLLV